MKTRFPDLLRGVFPILLSLAARSAVGGEAKWSFFAMDTAVRDLANLPAAKELGYAGAGWRFETAETMAASVASFREAGLPLVAVYGGAILTKDGVGFKGDLAARFAALAGTGTIVWLPVNSSDFDASDPAGDAVAVPELRRLADLASKHGLRVALYPHVGSWVERIQDAVRVAKQVDRPNFGATFNLCHCLRVGDEAKIPALLAEAAPHLFLVTVNGADRNAAGASWERLIRPLDEGDFSVAGLLAELETIGYAGPVGLQAFGVKAPVRENLERSLRAWRAMTASNKP